MAEFNLSELFQQAQQLQEKLKSVQEEAASELVTASAGGGMVKVTATAGGEITKIEIDPKAIDPSDPELLADLVMAAVNEALRSGRSLLGKKAAYGASGCDGSARLGLDEAVDQKGDGAHRHERCRPSVGVQEDRPH